MSTKEKGHNLSWELFFICWEILRLQAWETASQATLRKLFQEGRECSQVI